MYFLNLKRKDGYKTCLFYHNLLFVLRNSLFMFISLHNHSHYSLLDGLPKIGGYVKKAQEFGQHSLALTDHGTMYGVIEFYQKCTKAGIKPIIGCEMYLAPRALHLKHPGLDDKARHLLLLAKNYEGYKNLIYLSTVAHLDGFYYKPRIDKKILRKKSSGLIATSACLNGEIPKALMNNQWEKAVALVKEYQDIFGQENFYLELEYIGEFEDQIKTNLKLKELSQATNASLVAARDTHYLNDEDKIAQDVLVCVQTGKTLTDTKRLNMTGVDLSYIHPDLMTKIFIDTPEAIKNTELIAEKCNLELTLGKWHFPQVELPNNTTAEQQLINIAENGFKKKFPNPTEEEKKRLAYELQIINQKGYAAYFLIVSDLIKWARSADIVTTTRGSCAGSLVGYVTDITTLNPLAFGLPFERFLNPFRPSLPDIDMDFADNRRDEVIAYAKKKYGYDKVANIATFGTMMARGAVRDVTRVLDLPYEFGDKISKMIPFGAQGFPMTIDKALREVPELKNIYETNADAKKVLDLAKKVEGCARHVSIHAAGVVISPTPLTDFTPLQKDPKGQRNIITQYEMHAVEDAGLVKMDFLGIRNLSILGDAVKIIAQTKNIKIELDKIPLNDQKTFQYISLGHTFGMFQLGGTGMTKWLMELKPTNIKEIMAMIALFRPGPMESIPEYIARKQGKKTITYLDKKLETILKDTYGVVTYQDDLLLIAIDIAGYNWETVDKFRKAVGKKIPELMAEQEKILIEGCQKVSGWTKEKAEALWQLFDPFKGYGFNKAHAASYALVAYSTAYLKAHYPAEFMTAVMTAESEDIEKIAEAVQECQKIGIKVLSPDVNFSEPNFAYINDQEIRFGFLAIKNLGADIAQTIITERKKNGAYQSLADFLSRVETKNLNKKSLEALTKSGALDSLAERALILANTEQLLNFVRSKQKQKNNGQISLFGSLTEEKKIPELSLNSTVPADLKQRLAWEKELLGLYISGHPFAEMSELIKNYITCNCLEAKNQIGQLARVAGVILKIQKITTKAGEPMLFAIVGDLMADVEIVVFPKILKSNPDIWQEDNQVLIIGTVSEKDDKIKILAEKIYLLEKEKLSTLNEQMPTDWQNATNRKNYTNGNGFNNNYNNNHTKNNPIPTGNLEVAQSPKITKIWITLPKFFNSNIHSKLKNVFEEFQGPIPVYLNIYQSGSLRKIETDFKISYSEKSRLKLEEIVGNGNIKIE